MNGKWLQMGKNTPSENGVYSFFYIKILVQIAFNIHGPVVVHFLGVVGQIKTELCNAGI